MIKEHIHDLFTEGLGDIFYMKYKKFVEKRVKNKTIKKILLRIHVVVYLFFLGVVAFIMFKLSFPL